MVCGAVLKGSMIREAELIIGEMSGGKFILMALLMTILSMIMVGCVSSVAADRCVIPGSEADIYNPGQKVIVAWNGTVENEEEKIWASINLSSWIHQRW